MLKVTQVRSGIGTKPKTRGTLRALGLRRPGDTNVLPDRPEIRGMLHRVPHMVTVVPVDQTDAAEPADEAPATKKVAAKKAAAKKAPATKKATPAKKAPATKAAEGAEAAQEES
jgi:large subunit ribosomal protein L30